MAFFVFFAGFACVALNAVLYYNYVVDSYDFIFKYTSMPRDLVETRYRDLYYFGLALAVISTLVFVLAAAGVVIMTHRAAGSVYGMKKIVDEIISGNSNARIRLREKDEFKDFAESFNRMMDRIQGK